jgi:RNA polymerase sigma-70 factor, ECF subfamily
MWRVSDVESSVGAVGRDMTFVQLFRAEYAAIVGLITVVVGERAVAEDLTQDAFGKAHDHWERIAGYERPGAWVRRVALNGALSWRRSRLREARALRRIDAQGPVAGPEIVEVWQAVAALPGQQRAAVALFYVEDRTTAEIAEILGCNESTARVHLHRGRQALKAALGRGAEDDDD